MSYNESLKQQRTILRDKLLQEPGIQQALMVYLRGELSSVSEDAVATDNIVQVRRLQGEAACLKRLLRGLSADAKAAP